MKKPVVLIVDDEPEARLAIADFMKLRFDCDFREANDGEEALRFVKSNPCDVMFLDIKLPKMSGIKVIKHAKDVNPKLDIIVVTGYASDEVAEESLKLGATDYAVKPLDLKALELKFRNILQKRKQRGSDPF